MNKEIEQVRSGISGLLEKIVESKESAEKVVTACDTVNAAWSGSDLVGHSDFYYSDFDAPPHDRRFSVEWGLLHGVPAGWHERSNEEVLQKIQSDSGAILEDLDKHADFIADEFERLRKQAIISFSAYSKEMATEVEKFSLQTKIDVFNQYWKRQIVTRDSEALYAGRKIPTHKYYWATATFLIGADNQLNEFMYLIDKVIAQSKSVESDTQQDHGGRTTYIDKYTLLRLSKIDHSDFDLSRLIGFCNELDDNYSLENFHACAMLLRAILDHIPPVFNKTDFADVCAQYGSRSFKDIMKPLNETAKKVGDDYLHTQISKKVLAVTKTQVSFQANLDRLMNEIAAILEEKQPK